MERFEVVSTIHLSYILYYKIINAQKSLEWQPTEQAGNTTLFMDKASSMKCLIIYFPEDIARMDAYYTVPNIQNIQFATDNFIHEYGAMADKVAIKSECITQDSRSNDVK